MCLGRKIRDVRPHLLHPRTEEMRPALHHRQNLPSLMILMFLFVQGLVDLSYPPTNLGFPARLPPAPPPANGERTRAVDRSRERSRPRSPLPEPQLIHIPMSDGDDQPQRHRSRSRERSYPRAQLRQGPRVQLMIVTDPHLSPSPRRQ